MKPISEKVIGRLTRYRTLLTEQVPEGRTHLFSYEIAAAMRTTDSQVRRDLMVIGTQGVPRHGYAIEDLLEKLDGILNLDRTHAVAVVGVGHLGRALISFLESSRSTLCIKAAFDSDPAKGNRVHAGVKCHPMEALAEVVAREGITLAILCVPAGAAQGVADHLVHAGIKGILNFAPVALRVPVHVALEEIVITTYLEKLAYFTTHPSKERRNGRHEER
jgi:redox-sensing transcriptional repressor